MRKLIISLLAGITCLLAANIATAASVELTATHTIVSETQTAQGSTLTVVNITVTNNSASSLSNISVNPIGPDAIVVPGTSTLTIPALAAGATATVSWNLELAGPPLMPGLPLHLIGTATDQTAQAVNTFVFSRGL